MRASGLALILVLSACGGDDGGPPDTGVTTERCTYVPLVATAGAGGTVTAGALTAGAAERVLHIPVGTALGGYTGRAGFLSSAGTVDARKVAQSGTFNPSIGVTNAPRVKALALTAGGETVVILKGDMIFAYEGMLFDLEEKLGPEFAGKVILATSHSHSAWAQFTGHAPLKLGAGELRDRVYKRFLEAFEGAARDALAARVPAKLGIFSTATFDPMDKINHNRRGDNDDLPGGKRGEDHLVMLRVDATDGSPIAMVPIFGQHPTINDQDNPFASADATGALEHQLEEQFDKQVIVMHLQSAGADTSAVGHGGVDCNSRPGKMSDPCFVWAAEEGHGRAAVTELMSAYTTAGTGMQDSLEIEMITRSIETGPHPETFSIRDGALTYAPFDPLRAAPDGVVYEEGGKLKSPIDEFNAQVGAGLCETESPMFPAAAIPGSEGIKPYGSCLKLDLAGEILGPIFNIDFGVDATHPVCETTRTTISALRIGDYVFGTLPGEVSILIADLVREKSPAGPDKTVVIGYSQGHVGYMLRPEDWMLGGYEPSVTFWGPLEAEYIVEKLLDLMPLARTPARENGVEGGTTRVATAHMTDNLQIDDPAPMAGTIPAAIPAVTWARTGTPAQAQPAAQIARVSGVATFTWFGDDPQIKTPKVTLEYEMVPGSGVYLPVVRKSGRHVEDNEIVLAYTPSPLQRSGPQTHVWVAEWQAVPWTGTTGNDGLDARGGVALGKYRFSVEGNGWSISSNAFEVIPGGVALGAITRTGGNIRTPVNWFAPKGWRLMDMSLMSNQPIPVRTQTVTVTLKNLANVAVFSDAVTTDANGNAVVPDNAAAATVQITDRFGNIATALIP